MAGTSQCHFTGRIRKNEKCLHRFMTGNEKHSSGGWYTFVCPHGLIYASRLLFLKESVRDAGMKADLPSTITRYILGDLWLSLRYRPPVTISDTACTFTSKLCKMNFQ